MFCDLVGSTQLSAQIDPEDLAELYQVYRRLTEQVMDAYDGYVAEYLGDGIVCYFGYPVALENAAERCVRAALATITALQQAEMPVNLHDDLALRIGIATGLVVAGDLLGSSDSSQVRTVVGETPNLAARLQSLAQPNHVVIADSTRRLLGDGFLLDELQPVQLKGIPGLVTPWLVRGTDSNAVLRAASRQDIAIVGRSKELSLFTEHWRKVEQGRGQTLLISGEPGIGKSRLVRGFNEQLAELPHRWIALLSSDIYQNTALYPVAELLRRAFDFSEQDPAPAMLQLEAALVNDGEPPEETLPLFYDLLSVPYAGEDATAELSPEARRRRMLNKLVHWVFRLASEQPLVLVAEDLHWVDPSTLELLSLLIEQSQKVPILIVVTHRPEFEAPWLALPHVHSLPLQPLGRADIIQLAKEISGDAPLSAQVLDLVASKTDGVPLFIEELTKSVLEAGSEQPSDGGNGAAQGSAPVPTTLRDSLMSRLDRLGSAKELAQWASVVGREFSYALLAALTDLADQVLQSRLSKLVDSQLAYQLGAPPEATYTFRHALIQDTAYQSLLNRKRQSMHAELADVLIERFPDTASREPEVMAQHYARGSRPLEAIAYYLQAAQYAQKRSALQEAVNHLRNGLSLVPQLSSGPERDQQELSLLIALSGPLIATTGYANPEVEQVCARALGLCNSVGGGPDLPFAIYGLTTYYLNTSNLKACRDVAQMLMDLTKQPEFQQHRAVAHLQLGFVDVFSGQLEAALSEVANNRRHYEKSDHTDVARRYGQDPGATAFAMGTLPAWQLGHVDLALDYGRRGVTQAKQQNDPFTLAVCQVFLTLTHICRRERAQALALAEETIALCEHQHFPQWLHQARVTRGWALADGSATTAEGLAEVRSALAGLATVSAVIGAPIFMVLLTQSLMAAGMNEPALATVKQALTDSNARGNRWMDPELLRLQALLVAAAEDPNWSTVSELLERSLAEARRTNSRIPEVRSLCATEHFGLARAEHYARLQVLAGELDQGQDTADMRDMQAVLARK